MKGEKFFLHPFAPARKEGMITSMKAATQAAPEFELPAHLRTALLFGMACISTMAAAVFLELSVMSSVCYSLWPVFFISITNTGFNLPSNQNARSDLFGGVYGNRLLGRYSKEDNLYYGIRMEDFQNSPVQQGLLTAFIAAGLLLFFYFCFQRLYECAGRFTILAYKGRRRWKTGPFFCAVFSLFLSAGSPIFSLTFPGFFPMIPYGRWIRSLASGR